MTVLFIFAHPDDESYGPLGTIADLAKNNEVIVVSLCNGARPGNEHVANTRSETFVQCCEHIGAKWILYNEPDCSLKYDPTLSAIEHLVNHYKPDVVYTHNISDIHRDHRLVAECCLVACRPKPQSTVNELYFCEMPASTSWSFGQISPQFMPNVYKDITDYVELKESMLGLYNTETYEFPDARSIDAVITLAKTRGYQSGFKFAEAFQLVFSRVQRTL